MTPEETKEFIDYLLEQFQRGVNGEPWRPMFGGQELVNHQVAAKALRVLVTPYGLANEIKKALIETDLPAV